MKKDLLAIEDLTADDVENIMRDAFHMKAAHDRGLRRHPVLDGRVVALVFEKPSLRTKVAFEVATTALGGTPIFLSSSQILASGQQEHGRESIPDIARNLERFCDLIVARVYHHEVLTEIANSIRSPVINALCNRHHPTQALADLMAIRWHFGSAGKLQERIKVAFIGDGNNVATSLVQICALTGIDAAVASPEGYQVPLNEQAISKQFAGCAGSSVNFTTSTREALEGADVVYTDTFVSMGQEAEAVARKAKFASYQVNRTLMQHAKPNALFMHCLPAHRGEEVTNEVMDSKQSIVFDQAECRLHVAKALLVRLLAQQGSA